MPPAAGAATTDCMHRPSPRAWLVGKGPPANGSPLGSGRINATARGGAGAAAAQTQDYPAGGATGTWASLLLHCRARKLFREPPCIMHCLTFLSNHSFGYWINSDMTRAWRRQTYFPSRRGGTSGCEAPGSGGKRVCAQPPFSASPNITNIDPLLPLHLSRSTLATAAARASAAATTTATTERRFTVTTATTAVAMDA